MRKRKWIVIDSFLFAAALCTLLLMVDACRRNVDTKNPQVLRAATLLDASQMCVTIEDGVVAANNILESIQAQEPDYYAHVKPLLQKISSSNVLAVRKIQAFKNGDTSADWRGGLIAVAQSVNPKDLDAVGIKNANTKAIVQAAMATLVLALEIIPQKISLAVPPKGPVPAAPFPLPFQSGGGWGELIVILLQLGIKYTPQAVKDISALLHGHPKTPGETDEAYLTRIGGLIDANVAKVEAGDAEVQGSEGEAGKQPAPTGPGTPTST